MMYNVKCVGTGFFKFQVFGQLYEVLTEYDIIDHSTEHDSKYLVQRANEPDKQMWANDFIEAQDLCKQDYKARFE